MKNSVKLISVLLAGGIAGSASAQLVVGPAGGGFDALSQAFTNDVTSLFSDSANDYNSFTFGWDGGDPSTSSIVTDNGYAPPSGSTGQASELDFSRLTENPSMLTLQTPLNVAYIGNESNDNNFFGIEDITGGGAGDQTLFNYQNLNNAGADGSDPLRQPPPHTYTVSAADFGDGYDVSFWHEDAGGPGYPGNPRDSIANQDRFYIFEATDNVTVTTEGLNRIISYDIYWLLAIDDRETQLIDFDDGLFLLHTSLTETIAIPEPSTVGFGAIALLLGLGVTRRSRRVS